jgi:UDP-N-acetylmuramoyl-L-alanyl-D-glutamate--2,6-diaminopimelate ligase
MTGDMVRLSRLAASIPGDCLGDADISSLTADSRAARPGSLFAALSGTKQDGLSFVEDALTRGASAILTEREVATTLFQRGVSAIGCDNPRLGLARAAAAFFNRQPEVVAAVTGTNGKTSIAHFTREMWRMLGFSAGSIGTLGIISADDHQPLIHTTPDPIRLHRALADLADQKIDHVVIEASSHGLDQYRLDGVNIQAAGLTNITRDHLDYHASFEDYVAAKMRLFTDLLPKDGTAVINLDGEHTDHALAIALERGLNIITVGKKGTGLRLTSLRAHESGQALTINADDRDFEVNLALMGGFQASNALVAAGLLVAGGIAIDSVLTLLPHLPAVPGRMERVGVLSNGASIFVDYAHTPDALASVLEALRPHATGRLIVVFGCGGDRDAGKRPEMGAIAEALADRVIVTDDNPRSENPGEIRRQILAGMNRPHDRAKVQDMADRAEAIQVGANMLTSGDILIIAGKGHETGQIIGDKIIPFDDREIARAAIDHIGGVR